MAARRAERAGSKERVAGEAETTAAGRPVTQAPTGGALVVLRAALIAAGAALLVTYFFCPRFVLWRGLDVKVAWNSPEVIRATATLKQLRDPWVPVDDPRNYVIAWRLLFPLIWHALGLPDWSFLILPHIGCLLTLAYASHLVLRRTGNRTWAFCAAALLGTCTWFFVSTGWLTYFDSWVIGALLLLVYTESRAVVVLTVLLAPWIDDRVLLAMPLCFVLRYVELASAASATESAESAESAVGRRVARDAVAALVPVLAYVAMRVWLAHRGGHETYKYAQENLTLEHLHLAKYAPERYLRGVWSALRGAWFFVAVVFWWLRRTRRRRELGALAAVFILTLYVGLAVAQDLGRTVCIVVPLVLSGILTLARVKPQAARVALPAVLAINLLLPAEHVVTEFVIPIRYLYHEIDQWDNPPPFVNAGAYVRQAFEFLQQGNLTQALEYFDDALKLDPNQAAAYNGRGWLRFNTGELTEAAADLDKAVSLDPTDPENHYARAVLRLRRGQRDAAEADLRRALDLARPDWPRRQEAQELLAKIAASSPSPPSPPSPPPSP